MLHFTVQHERRGTLKTCSVAIAVPTITVATVSKLRSKENMPDVSTTQSTELSDGLSKKGET